MTTVFGIVLGVLVGLRHAFEPDHLTAVSTLVTETHSTHSGTHSGTKRGALLGVLWGLGHTASLVVVGVILMIVGETLPERAGVAFELGVSVMLLMLGVRAIVIALGNRGFVHTHAHGEGHGHSHGHSHSYLKLSQPVSHVHSHVRARRLRPVVVGLVHGLAGSGALTAIVFAKLPGAGERILYMVLFGTGSIAGMAIASGVAGATLGYLARSTNVRRRIAIASGALSIVVGVLWAVPLLA